MKSQDCLRPLTWLAESSEYAARRRGFWEVLAAVKVAANTGQKVETLDLLEEYLKEAGALARVRAAFAAHRLAGILSASLRAK
jgi:hypothetical protein